MLSGDEASRPVICWHNLVFVSFNTSSVSIKRLMWLGWTFKLLMDSSRMNVGAYLWVWGRKETLFFFFFKRYWSLLRDWVRTFVLAAQKMAMSSFLLFSPSWKKKWLALYNKHSRVHSVQKPHMQTYINKYTATQKTTLAPLSPNPLDMAVFCSTTALEQGLGSNYPLNMICRLEIAPC